MVTHEIVHKTLSTLCVFIAFASVALANEPGRILDSLTLIDAIKISLENNNQLKIDRVTSDVEREKIGLQDGQFDSTISLKSTVTQTENPVNTGSKIVAVNNDTSSISLGVEKQLKFSPIVSITTSADSYGNEYNGVASDEVANANLNLSITFPLWKGFGEYITTLPLELSKLAFKASTFDLKHKLDISIVQTITNYWNYRGSVETLEFLIESEKRSEKMLQELQKLIKADELPAAELNIVKAQLSQRKGARLNGEKSLVEARSLLATSLGMFLSSSNTETKPVTKLAIPPVIDFDNLLNKNFDSLLKDIMLTRNDFTALDTRIDAATKQIDLAKEEDKPTLNFAFGHTSKLYKAEKGLFKALDGDRFGPGLSASLQFQWKPMSSGAKANLQISRFQLRQYQISKNELQRSTKVDLNSSIFSFIQSGRNYTEAKERLELSIQNLKNERKKFVLGSATILDVLNIEDKLLQAKLDVVQERINYGTILAKLMFITGQLGVTADDTVVLNDLTSGIGLINKLKNY